MTRPRLAWGPSVDEWTAALATARELSVEQAAGQVIVAQWSSPDADGLAQLVEELGLGGVIVMRGAVDDAAQVKELTAAARSAGGARDWGTIVSVDEEGGTVSRLRGVVPGMPGFMAAGAARDEAAVTDAYAQQAVDLRGLGFTMDFAPVADVTRGLSDPVIRSRAAGDDPEVVAATVNAAVDGYIAGGVAPVVKHFPGHGSVTVDSHVGLPVQARSIESLVATDLAPFASAIDEGAPAVMMAHVAVEDWGSLPASLNPRAYVYLRETLGFTGLAVTDALNMGAIQNDHEPGEAAVAALKAGADVLLLPPEPEAARDAIVDAVEDGDLTRERLTEAAARVILAGRWQAGLESVADAGASYAHRLAVAGATVAAKSCGGSFVGTQVSISGGTEGNRAALGAALAERGVSVGGAGTSIALAGSDDSSPRADVVVALRGPWGLEDADADVYVGLYGTSGSSMNALADVLTGAASPGGTWPVDLDLPVPVCGSG